MSSERPPDPHDLVVHVESYLDYLACHNYAPRTVSVRRFALGRFLQWCQVRSLDKSIDVTRWTLESYQRHLYHYRRDNEQPLKMRTQYQWLQTVKSFFGWLVKQQHLLVDPSAHLELPRMGKPLPRSLSRREVEEVLAQPDVTRVNGMRDRAMMELLYATGMRASELAELRITEVDFEERVVTVVQGKWRKDRVVPVGERALGWVERYLREVRLLQVLDVNRSALFLTEQGTPLNNSGVSGICSRYLRQAGKSGSSHLFRYSMATHMLNNGADIRFVQQMLGHEDLKTTQQYTLVTVRQLQQVYERTHPAGGGGRGDDETDEE